MERRWDLDLTYVTERILAASFPARPDEQRHRGHLRELAHVLQSKHRDKYLVRDGTGRIQPMRGLGGADGRGCSLTSIAEARPPGGSTSARGRRRGGTAALASAASGNCWDAARRALL
jgi:hypothetical protein